MFCPRINDECKGNRCAKWSAGNETCVDRLQVDYLAKYDALLAQYDWVMKMIKLSWDLEISRILKDPSVPEETREAIRHAENVEAVERLLRDNGIL
ncbi:hypothetical protein LCGC14_1452870 [marine sediment metagenome]|uniref:Uncharacterized protein n=1 Tax=marine sediment metagenome TaxID=412755 RepID=A0A0F9MJ37_9ZZZZ